MGQSLDDWTLSNEAILLLFGAPAPRQQHVTDRWLGFVAWRYLQGLYVADGGPESIAAVDLGAVRDSGLHH